MTQTFSSGTGFSKSRVIRTQCQPRPQSQERSLRVGRKRHVREEAEFAFGRLGHGLRKLTSAFSALQEVGASHCKYLVQEPCMRSRTDWRYTL